MEDYDLIIVGAGPGGYVAAILAGKNGFKTALIEEEKSGGVCLNWGCIPSKSLLASAVHVADSGILEEFGFLIDRSKFDYARVQKRSRAAAERLSTGVGYLLKKNRVTLLPGHAELDGDRTVMIDGKERLRGKNLIIATGSRTRPVNGFLIDEKRILSSRGLLAMTSLPKSMLILGGGAIGIEFAYILAVFGVKVTVAEMRDSILPQEDGEGVRIVASGLERIGISIRTGTKAAGYKEKGDCLAVELERKGVKETIDVEKVLVAVGRIPNVEGLGLGKAGVALQGGRIETNDYYSTSSAGVYAIGDVIGQPMLAHAASAQARIVVNSLAGKKTRKRIDEDLVPRAVYCEPQLASFGLSEERALEKGLTVKKSVFPLRGAGKSVAVGKSEGHVKILVNASTGELLGAQTVGLDASETIHELLLAKSSELLAEDISRTVHAHPTLSEAVMEAAEGILGEPIHL